MTRKHVYHRMDTNGDGTGTWNANGDYSSTPLRLKFDPQEAEVIKIRRMFVYVQDTGSFDASFYGNGIDLSSAGGIRVYHKNAAGEVLEELTAFPIKSTGDWAGNCSDTVPLAIGNGDEILSVRWTFQKSGIDVILKGSDGEYLEVELDGDFSGLNVHRFKIDGFYADEDLT